MGIFARVPISEPFTRNRRITMLEKVKNIRKLLGNVIRVALAEWMTCVIFFLISLASFYINDEVVEWVWSFPACFSLIYVTNRQTRANKFRWTYYLSVLFIPVFYAWNLSVDHFIFWITLIISQLLIVLGIQQTDNDSFARNALCYALDVSAAILLTFLGWLLAFGIYGSFLYIFDLYASERDYLVYSSLAAFFLIAPLIFLMFNISRKGEFLSSPFFRVLMNFIVTPSLLIYNLILYLYIVKIAVTHTLPKGGVAYMVLIFITLFFISKVFQAILQRRYYNWYYHYFSYWVLFPLCMLWLSIFYRVGEYGWTEARIYLALAALIATITMILFFSSRGSKYRWITFTTILILVFFTYVPGINAEWLGLYSQENRINNAMEFLYVKNGNKWTQATDSVTFQEYKNLYSSVRYVQQVKDTFYMQQHFGIGQGKLIDFIPKEVMEQIQRYPACDHTFSVNYYQDQILNISGFDSLLLVDGHGNITYDFTDGRLVIYNLPDTLFNLDLNSVFRKRLMENGMDTLREVNREQLNEKKELFRIYEQENKQLVLHNMWIDVQNVTVKDVNPCFLLIRKESP